MNMKALAQTFVSRAEGLNLKGKKRDEAALNFYCGAAAVSCGQLQQSLLMHASMIYVRGYQWVKECAEAEPKAAA